MATATQPLTFQQIIDRHADNIAFVAEATPATTADNFIEQLHKAALNLSLARINDVNDLDTASTYLAAAQHADASDQPALLKRASSNLKYLADMVDEYRLMV